MPTARPTDEPARIIALARGCAEKTNGGRGIGGSPLRFGAATASKRDASSTWIVHFPEEQPRSLPSGLDIVVNASTGTCGMAPMD